MLIKRKSSISGVIMAAIMLVLVMGGTVFAAEDILLDAADMNWVAADNTDLELDGAALPMESETYNGKPVYRINITGDTHTWWIVQYKKDGWDLPSYAEDGYVEFAIKGSVGGEVIYAGFRTGDWAAGTLADALVPVEATTDWKVYQIPVKDILATNESADISDNGLFTFRDTKDKVPLKVWISDLKIIAAGASQLGSAEPREESDTPPANPDTGDFGIIAYGLLAVASSGLLLKHKKNN